MLIYSIMNFFLQELDYCKVSGWNQNHIDNNLQKNP